jgi:peptidylprolyl isomerase
MAHPQSGDTVKVHYTARLDDGRVFDSSKEREPLELTIGEGKPFPAFEDALTQMEPGEERTVKIPSDRAYGPHRPELVLAVDRTEFPSDIEPEVGQQLRVRHDQGQVSVVTVADVSDQQVTIDANHPLAGRDLTLDLELVEVGARRSR